MTAPGAEVQTESVLFEAVLRPHRSLTRQQTAIVLAAMGAVTSATGLLFYLIGAWPVVGFLGLDFGLLYLAFRLNFRDARRRETIRLTPTTLTVAAEDPKGRRRETHLEAYWARVSLDRPLRPSSQVRLASRGTVLTVGRFLVLAERARLAEHLEAALHALRNPRFS